MKILQAVWVCCALAGCAGAPVATVTGAVDTQAVALTADLAQTYAALQANGGRVFTLDPQTSAVRIYAFRGGRAAKFGHNHVLSAPAFRGYFYLAPDGPAASRFDLEFRLDQLAFDDPQQRAALGAGFASAISAEDTASTRNNMLGDNGLQAARFPWVRIQSLHITGDSPKFAANIAVQLHGQTRSLWAPLTVTGLPDQLVVEGALVLRQTDFGIQPFSVLGGLLAVQDEVVVEFRLAQAKP